MAEYRKLSTNRPNPIQHECEEFIASNSTTHIFTQFEMEPRMSNSNNQQTASHPKARLWHHHPFIKDSRQDPKMSRITVTPMLQRPPTGSLSPVFTLS